MTRASLKLLFLAATISLAACKKDGDDNIFGTDDGQPMTTSGATTTATDATDSIGDETSDSIGDDGATKLDVADGGNSGDGDGDGDGDQGCRAVDFLFVIDNSGSMAGEQSALISSFPKFIDAINENLDVQQDYHIMVTDVDAWQYAECPMLCTFFGGCPPFPLPPDPDFTCDDPDTPEDETTVPEPCENVLGAGVIDPKGMDASGPACNFSSGARFIDKTEPDVKAAFECAARVGTGSYDSPERPMEAMVAAVGDSGEIAQCNQGFLRDDAILVVTFITDEDDDAGDGSVGTPDGWKTALMSAKNLDDSGIVVLGVFGGLGGCEAESSTRLEEFVSLFGERGFHGDICASSYESFFLDAVNTIQTTCEEFVPPVG